MDAPTGDLPSVDAGPDAGDAGDDSGGPDTLVDADVGDDAESGTVRWEKTYGNGAAALDGYDIAGDDQGNVYVTGQGNEAAFGVGPQSSISAFLVALDTKQGQYWWQPRIYAGTQAGSSVGIDAKGNVYVAGSVGSSATIDFGDGSPKSCSSGIFVASY